VKRSAIRIEVAGRYHLGIVGAEHQRAPRCISLPASWCSNFVRCPTAQRHYLEKSLSCGASSVECRFLHLGTLRNADECFHL